MGGAGWGIQVMYRQGKPECPFQTRKSDGGCQTVGAILCIGYNCGGRAGAVQNSETSLSTPPNSRPEVTQWRRGIVNASLECAVEYCFVLDVSGWPCRTKATRPAPLSCVARLLVVVSCGGKLGWVGG